VAIIAPSEANASAWVGASPTPRARLVGVTSLGSPRIGSKGRTMTPSKSRPIRLRFNQGTLALTIRARLGPPAEDPGIGPSPAGSRRGVDGFGDPREPGGRGNEGSMAGAS